MAGVSPAGTATTVRWWLLVERPGPWPATAVEDALTDLVPPAGRGAVDDFRAEGGRVLLIRPVGRGRRAAGGRRVFLAISEPARERIWGTRLPWTTGLRGVDLDAVRAGRRPAGMVAESGPMFLVCTHGGRDVCCALAGRPIAAELRAAYGRRVWECSHVGGNLFAGNMVTLPFGFVHGGLRPETAGRVAARLDAGLLPLEHLRGRSVWGRWGQHAEIAVRRRLAAVGHPAAFEPGAVQVRQELSGDTSAQVVVTVAGTARRWLVSLRQTAFVEVSAERCGLSERFPEVRSQVIAGDPVGVAPPARAA
jgi:hypothetical protein